MSPQAPDGALRRGGWGWCDFPLWATMKFPIGAMSVGDVLDRGLKILFARLALFYTIDLIVLAPSMLFFLAIALYTPELPPEPTPDEFLSSFLTFVGFIAAGFAFQFVLTPFSQAADLHVIMREYLGEPTGLKQSFSFALTRFFPLLLTSILKVLILIVTAALTCGILGIYFSVCFLFVGQVVVLENLSGPKALGRSNRLIDGFRGRVFGVLLLIGVVNFFAQQVLGFFLGLLLPPMVTVQLRGHAVQAINPTNYAIILLILQFVNILLQTYTDICATLLYLDLRIRKEGFDLELAARGGDNVPILDPG